MSNSILLIWAGLMKGWNVFFFCLDPILTKFFQTGKYIIGDENRLNRHDPGDTLDYDITSIRQ